jgi:hypothetical protein
MAFQPVSSQRGQDMCGREDSVTEGAGHGNAESLRAIGPRN